MSVDNNNGMSPSTLGTAVAFTVPYAMKKTIIPNVTSQALSRMYKVNASLSQPEKDVLEKAADEALKLAKVDKKGVKFERVNEHTVLSQPEQAVIDAIEKSKLPKRLKEIRKETLLPKYCAMKGHTAFFNAITNVITYNKEKLPLAAFHEIGHSMNKFYSHVGKSFQHIRMKNRKTAGVISMLALLAPSKTEQNMKPQTNDDKLIGKFRDYSGLLVAGAMAPTVIEEGMASYKGNKLAKKLLNPELLKKVKTTNLAGFITYAVSPIVLGLGTYLGVQAKNNIIAHNVTNTKKV